MKYLGFDALDNYTPTYFVRRFPYTEGEAIILVPKNGSGAILLGVNRVPYLAFVKATFTVTTYELFEIDWTFNYSIVDDRIEFDTINEVGTKLCNFSSMILDVMKSAGTETMYLSEMDNRNLVNAVKTKNIAESKQPILNPSKEIIVTNLQNSNSLCEVLINGKPIFRSTNKKSCDTVFELIKKLLQVFIRRLQAIK